MTLISRSTEEILAQLKGALGAGAVKSGDEASRYSTRGEAPVAVVSPAGESEVAAVAGVANAERIPVVVWGGGTKQNVPPVQPRDGLVLRTAKLNKTVELDTGNLTVRVEAGKVLGELQKELAAQKLLLPLDPPDANRATVGGMLATNSSGPSRLLYRTARDWLLGVRVVTPAGEICRFGGKTIKDVAGYDMKKLYLGSWGTLGAITEATLRLLPLPEARATVAISFPRLSDACGTVSDILGSFLRPSAMDLLSWKALPKAMTKATGLKDGEYLLIVAAEGTIEAVERHRRDLPAIASKHGSREDTTFEGAEDAQLWHWRSQLFARPPRPESAVLVKGSVLLTRVFDFINGVSRAGDEQGLTVSTASHAGNGIVHAQFEAAEGETTGLVTAVERSQRLAAECGGFLMIQQAPDDVLERVQIWPRRSDYGLMQRIKAEMDPNDLWNPARVPGGRA